MKTVMNDSTSRTASREARRHRRWVQHFASVIALFPLLALAGVGYETMWQTSFPYDGSHPGIRVLCGIGLASLVCLAAFAGLLMGYHKKLKRLRWGMPSFGHRTPAALLGQA